MSEEGLRIFSCQNDWVMMADVIRPRVVSHDAPLVGRLSSVRRSQLSDLLCRQLGRRRRNNSSATDSSGIRHRCLH